MIGEPMSRSQFLAALIVVGALGALVVARVQSGAEAGAGSDQEAAAEAASEPKPITGGEQAAVGATPPAPQTTTLVVAEPPPILEDKPALTDLDGWLQTEATSLDDFSGQVRIVEFWTFGCFNCKNRLPYTQEIYRRWQPEGLEIIAVHAPEFDYEKDPEAVAAAAADLGVVWPIALDTNKTNFRAWQGSRRFWPRTYVLDQEGRVRYDHIGEGDYDGLETTVAQLITNGP